ncbi:MAG: Hsp70 family protein [Deltaproteobacteria bacterium]|nr:Hsp70 family protein [Deltaproteobacteria bacterium]
MRFGIDFGTTRTVVAGCLDSRHPVASFDEDGEYKEHVPGIAAVVGGQVIVGWDAARAVADGSAEQAIRSIKRVISTLAPDQPVPGLPNVTALELATLFLRELRRVLVERSNLELDPNELFEVMVAVPASAPSRQRWLTLEAFRRSGFQPIGLLNEPTAAAIELAHLHLSDLSAGKRRSPKKYVVVYDLGGGTFDASAVSLEGQRFELIATEGLATLGGDDFDALILELAGIVPTPQALERAREAKESLRAGTKKLLLESDDDSITIDVAELYTRAQPLVDQTIAQVEQLFSRLVERGIDPDDPRELGGVYLVGGGVAFPAVQRSLRARFGKKLQLAPQPFAATAVGLAIAADPAAQISVRETITRHFGVWREADDGVDKVFDSLIGKNSDAPTVIRRYRPTHAVGHLRFLECGALDDAGQPVQDLVPCTDVYFPYDPALGACDETELAQVPNVRRSKLADEIAETYTYAPDGTISVHIENVSRGYGRTFHIGALR